MIRDQLIRSMGGIRLSRLQQTRLAWLASAREVSEEQILSDIVDAYLGSEVPAYSTEEKARFEERFKALAKKFDKSPNEVKADIRVKKIGRYHLTDTEAKTYHDYLVLNDV
jgi:hypothetical protein